jgi:hypothetical protein
MFSSMKKPIIVDHFLQSGSSGKTVTEYIQRFRPQASMRFHSLSRAESVKVTWSHPETKTQRALYHGPLYSSCKGGERPPTPLSPPRGVPTDSPRVMESQWRPCTTDSPRAMESQWRPCTTDSPRVIAGEPHEDRHTAQWLVSRPQRPGPLSQRAERSCKGGKCPPTPLSPPRGEPGTVP